MIVSFKNSPHTIFCGNDYAKEIQMEWRCTIMERNAFMLKVQRMEGKSPFYSCRMG